MHTLTHKNDAEVLHRQGNLGQAKIQYETHLTLHPTDADVWHALGILHAQCNQPQEGLLCIQKALTHKKNEASFFNSLGNVFRQLDDLDQAKQAYQQAIKINPRYAIAYNNLGAIYFKQDKNISAKQAYEKAIALHGNYADACINLAIILMQEGDEAIALAYLQKALSMNANSVTALSQLSDYYLRHDNYQAAYDTLSSALRIQPNHIDHHYRLGIANYHLKKFDEACAQFDWVMTIEHNYLDVNQYMANTLLELKDFEKAMHYYFRQLSIQNYFETLYNIGVLFMMKEQLKDAIIYFNHALEKNPADLACHLNLGNIYLKRNELDRAVFYYEHANTLKPNDPEIQHILRAISQSDMPASAPQEYVSHLFDQYAAYYDYHLQTALKYDVPEKILRALQYVYPHGEQQWTILDVGCGTGLCGSLLKSYSKKIIGVDLSSEMIAVARTKHIYDELLLGDVNAGLLKYHLLDIITAADVFTYIGDLRSVFFNAYNALASQGLFIFTVEKTHEKDYLLQKSIRYAHSKRYLDALISECHFEVIAFDNIVLRQQQHTPVEGYLVLLKK